MVSRRSVKCLARNTVRHRRSSLRKIGRPGQDGVVYRLSGSKSSVAMLVELKLLEKGISAYVLTATTYGMGLNADSGAFPWPTARRICAGCRMWPHRSPIVATCAGAGDQPLLSTVSGS